VKRGMPLSVLLAAPEMDGLNEQVKRNLIRFPDDFMFRQPVKKPKPWTGHCDQLPKTRDTRLLPQMSILIVRAFVKVCELLATHKDLARKIDHAETSQKRCTPPLFNSMPMSWLPSSRIFRKYSWNDSLRPLFSQ
jgi:hypothetical protein